MTFQRDTAAAHPEQSRPWWRYPMVWLVISGPAAVVVASLVTAAVAVKHIDPVLDADTSVGKVKTAAQAPAVQGRNHAAEQSRAPADR